MVLGFRSQMPKNGKRKFLMSVCLSIRMFFTTYDSWFMALFSKKKTNLHIVQSDILHVYVILPVCFVAPDEVTRRSSILKETPTFRTLWRVFYLTYFQTIGYSAFLRAHASSCWNFAEDRRNQNLLDNNILWSSSTLHL